MSVPIIVLVLSSMLGVLAVVVLVSDERDGIGRRVELERGLGVRCGAGVAVAAIVVAACGWVLPAIVVGAVTWRGVAMWQRRDRRAVGEIERTEALASWIENLRDVLLAGDQPVGAINATVATCPAAIRPQVRRLAASLGRQDPDVVFRRFADEVDDPLGDLVAAGLLIAVGRGARTVAVLTALAQQARLQSDRRRLVEAERAPVQREVRLLSVVMGALVVGLLLLGRAEYLEPYGTAAGQTFLAVVLLAYGVLLLRVQRLARHPRPARFLTLGALPDQRTLGEPTATTNRPEVRPAGAGR
jgi:Flp pilus assembly protein TadB